MSFGAIVIRYIVHIFYFHFDAFAVIVAIFEMFVGKRHKKFIWRILAIIFSKSREIIARGE